MVPKRLIELCRKAVLAESESAELNVYMKEWQRTRFESCPICGGAFSLADATSPTFQCPVCFNGLSPARQIFSHTNDSKSTKVARRCSSSESTHSGATRLAALHVHAASMELATTRELHMLPLVARPRGINVQ